MNNLSTKSIHADDYLNRVEAVLSWILGGPCVAYASGLSAYYAVLTYIRPKKLFTILYKMSVIRFSSSSSPDPLLALSCDRDLKLFLSPLFIFRCGWSFTACSILDPRSTAAIKTGFSTSLSNPLQPRMQRYHRTEAGPVITPEMSYLRRNHCSSILWGRRTILAVEAYKPPMVVLMSMPSSGCHFVLKLTIPFRPQLFSAICQIASSKSSILRWIKESSDAFSLRKHNGRRKRSGKALYNKHLQAAALTNAAACQVYIAHLLYKFRMGWTVCNCRDLSRKVGSRVYHFWAITILRNAQPQGVQ